MTKHTYATLYPLSYFPAFPGSYWKYLESDKKDTVIIRTDPAYQKDSYVQSDAAYYSDTFYVPFYNHIPIWKYEAHTGPISHAGSYPLTTILSESLPIGQSWVIYHWSGTEISRKVIARDTAVTVSGRSYYPTLVVEEFYSIGPPRPLIIARRYYTRDIGMVREDLYSFDSTFTSKYLIDYFINR